MKDTRKSLIDPSLLNALFELLERHRPVFGQERIYHRIVGLVFAELFAFGRHTVTQLLLILGVGDDDWSSWYRLFSRVRFVEAKAARVMVKEVVELLPESAPLMTGFDGFQVPRCSRKMPGTSWLKAVGTAPFKPGIRRAQRFVEGSWFTPMENGYSRAIPLRCLPAFPEKAVPSAAGVCKEWEAAQQYLQWLRDSVDELGRTQQRILALADGAFDTLKMWEDLPKGVGLIVRTARNRCLYELPTPSSGPGRPAKNGKRAPAPADWLRKRKGFKRETVTVRGRPRTMRYRLEGPYMREGLPDIPLFLLVVGGGQRPPGSRRKRYEPCFFLISAVPKDDGWQLPLPIAELLAWLWQRWELEVAHREMKSGFGLGEKQCWHRESAILSVQWSAWVYALMILAAYQTWGLLDGPAPPGRWRSSSSRWSFNTLWRSYRAAFWQHHEFQASWSSTNGNWPKKEAFIAALNNAVIASART